MKDMTTKDSRYVSFRCQSDLLDSMRIFASQSEQTISGVIRLAIKNHIKYGKKNSIQRDANRVKKVL